MGEGLNFLIELLDGLIEELPLIRRQEPKIFGIVSFDCLRRKPEIELKDPGCVSRSKLASHRIERIEFPIGVA